MLRYRTLISSILTLLPIWIFTQNLLPNPGFEQISTAGCTSPVEGFKKLEHWYHLDATPDLFQRSCPFDETEFAFWDESVKPFTGNNFIGLWSRWNSDDSYFSEGIAIKLAEPLQANTVYSFEMALLNQGSYQGLGGSFGCSLNPEKHIDLYISHDSIVVVNNFAQGSARTEATLVTSMHSEEVTADGSEGWKKVSACFEALGGEQYFAIILPLGSFGPLPPCAATQATSGVFRSFYYYLDEFSLTELAGGQAVEITNCDNNAFEVDLEQIFDLSQLREAVFLWDDGHQGSQRPVIDAGIYKIEAVLDCGSVPLVIDVKTEACPDELYVPNAFTPNGDGINDLFQIHSTGMSQIEGFTLKLFDRWGRFLFEANDLNIGWNGKINDQEAPDGVYVWTIRYFRRGIQGGKQIVKMGSLVLIR